MSDTVENVKRNTVKQKSIRLECVYKGCKKYTVVRGDPTFNNWNFYNKKYGTFDIRNIGFVCLKHQKNYNNYIEYLNQRNDLEYRLDKGKAII
jgi:hypothetical protein